MFGKMTNCILQEHLECHLQLKFTHNRHCKQQQIYRRMMSRGVIDNFTANEGINKEHIISIIFSHIYMLGPAVVKHEGPLFVKVCVWDLQKMVSSSAENGDH